MKLTTLNPEFVGAGGTGIYDGRTGKPVPRREGVGLSFDCPCGCGVRGYVPFKNPLDGGASYNPKGWDRTGDTFDTITLRPSIHRPKEYGGCGWHGWISSGEVTSV